MLNLALHEVTWLFDECRLWLQLRRRSGYYNPLPWVIGQRKAIFWQWIIFTATLCSWEWCKIDYGVAERLTFLSQWPLCLWSFWGMSWLILLNSYSIISSEKKYSFTLLIYIEYFYMYKHTLNNVQLINALHKLLLPSSLCFGICGETKKYFHLNHLQAILFQYHAAKTMTWGARILS